MWNKLRAAAIAAYLLIAVLMGLDGPGMHYDEALFFNAAVHVVHVGGEPSFAHDPWSWFPFAGRRWPLMVLPYAGPVRSYLAMIPFALFGANYFSARILTTLLGAFGIWALSVLVRDQLGPRTAAIAAWILAIHPAYLLFTIYDQGGVAEWMLPFGLISLALARYLRNPASRSAFWLGLAMGFGLWSRANIAWLLGAAAIAAGRGLLVPVRHHIAAAAGGILGAAPLLAYEIRSRGATFAYIRGTSVPETLLESLRLRLGMLAETLLADPEMRKVWDGPSMPLWQSVFAAATALLALFLALKQPGKARFGAVTFLFLALCPLFSRLSVHPHHLVALVPIVAVLAAHAAAGKWRYVFYVAGVIYLGCALWWNLAAARGIRATGGANLWSDGIDRLKQHLLTNQSDTLPEALDWGLANSLFVLSNGKIRLQEVFWAPWAPGLAPGSVYVIHSTRLVVFPEAGEALRHALTESTPRTRRTAIHQRSGAEYAEVVEVLPK